eukprot:UN24440
MSEQPILNISSKSSENSQMTSDIIKCPFSLAMEKYASDKSVTIPQSSKLENINENQKMNSNGTDTTVKSLSPQEARNLSSPLGGLSPRITNSMDRNTSNEIPMNNNSRESKEILLNQEQLDRLDAQRRSEDKTRESAEPEQKSPSDLIESTSDHSAGSLEERNSGNILDGDRSRKASVRSNSESYIKPPSSYGSSTAPSMLADLRMRRTSSDSFIGPEKSTSVDTLFGSRLYPDGEGFGSSESIIKPQAGQSRTSSPSSFSDTTEGSTQASGHHEERRNDNLKIM